MRWVHCAEWTPAECTRVRTLLRCDAQAAPAPGSTTPRPKVPQHQLGWSANEDGAVRREEPGRSCWEEPGVLPPAPGTAPTCMNGGAPAGWLAGWKDG